MGFALAAGKLWSVHLNDQNGLKYDQDKAFGAANLRGAFDQVRCWKKGYGSNGEMVAFDVKAMRTTRQEHQLKHLANSREIFLALVDKARSLDRRTEQELIAARDYEELDRFIVRHLMGSRPSAAVAVRLTARWATGIIGGRPQRGGQREGRLVKRLDRILVAALWAVAAVAASAATERTVVPLAPGLDYVRLTADGPVVTHLLLADLNVPSLRPAVAMAGPQVLGVETLSEIVNAVETGTQRVAGAINGGHAVTRPGSFRGAPIGLLIAGRELLCDPWPVPRSAFLLLADGTPRIERLAMQGKLAGPDGQAVRLGGLNRRRLPGELVLYTARFNPATRIDEAGVQLVVAGAFKDGRMLVAGQSYTGRVEAKVDGRVNVEIPPDGVVLAGSGPSESWLEARKIGEPVTFSFELTPDVGQVTDALGAGPRILRDGQVAIEAAQEQLGVTLQTGPQPRSAVGYAGRKLVFAAVDGRDSAHSLGLELPALAQLLLDEGCTDAMELDGGGATTLYARDRVINQPSDGMPRPLASALVLLTSGALTTDALPGTLAADGAAPVPTPVRPTPPTTPTVPPVTPVTPTVPPVTPVTPTTPTVPDTPTTPSTPLVDGTPVRLRTVPADLRGEPGEALPMQIIAEDAEGRAVRFNAADLRFDVAPPALGEIDASGRFLARVQVSAA